jgi:hypothetical protein
VLGNLQTQNQIKAPLQMDWQRKVTRQESLLSNLQKCPVNVVTIDPPNVGDTAFRKNREPSSQATTDIDRSSWLNRRNDEREHSFCGLPCSSLLMPKEIAGVGLRHNNSGDRC